MTLKKIGNLVSYILAFASILFLAWMFLSWVEVVSHNLEPGYIYSNANFFIRMLEVVK